MSDVWRSSEIDQKIANNRTEQIPNNLRFDIQTGEKHF